MFFWDAVSKLFSWCHHCTLPIIHLSCTSCECGNSAFLTSKSRKSRIISHCHRRSNALHLTQFEWIDYVWKDWGIGDCSLVLEDAFGVRMPSNSKWPTKNSRFVLFKPFHDFFLLIFFSFFWCGHLTAPLTLSTPFHLPHHFPRPITALPQSPPPNLPTTRWIWMTF